MSQARPARNLLSILITATLPALAAAQAPTTAPPAAGAPAGAPAPAAPAAQPRPFKDIIKDAKEMPGFFTVWQKDERVWLEIRPEQLGMPFFYTYNITNSIGERGLYGSQMGRGGGGGRGQIVYFRKIGNQVQLVAQNHRFRAAPGTPQAEFVQQSFAESLISAANAVSLPHPERKSILIDTNALLIKDLPMMASTLDSAFRAGYNFDAAHSHFTRVRATESANSFNMNAHFSIPKLAPPPLTPTPVPAPPPPNNLPDVRSMFIGFIYNFAQLPAPMAPREADGRVGHFTTRFLDYTDDLKPSAARHYVNRWRLEKKDPQAPMSEPKQPIVFWIDRNVPEKYRDSVRAGILEWNKAFEKIGFKDALVAKQQSKDDDFDTLDSRHASIRWFTGSDVGFAIGPSHVDPRTGEILDADIGMSDVFARGARRLRVEEVAHTQSPHGHLLNDGHLCTFGHDAAQELDFAMDLLEARGLDPDGPEAEALAQAYVKDVIIHEVGHTLGLRHNYRSSTIYTQDQLNDPQFTRKNGMAGSIMDYTPYNIAAKGEKQGDLIGGTIGPYDYWAVEYAYKPIEAAQEKAELARIAGRSNEPWLAYATDEDAGFGGAAEGMDPAVNRFDMTADPLGFYKKRMTLSRELWDRLQTKQLAPGESYVVLRRNFINGFNALNRVAPLAAKYVGGVTALRDHAGSGRAPFTPLPAAQQREALKLIAEGLFSPGSFNFPAEFLQRLGVDHLERFAPGANTEAGVNPTVSVASLILRTQRTVLDHLLSEPVAQRITDTQLVANGAARPLQLAELYDTLHGAIWSELKSGSEIPALRRNLQREHLKRIAAALLRPPAAASTDVRSLQRQAARELLAQLRAVQIKPSLSRETRAHLADAANTLDEALKAPLARAGA
jgi:hypothetical protein